MNNDMFGEQLDSEEDDRTIERKVNDKSEIVLQGTIWGQWEPERMSLSDRFIVPPFSVLDTRQSYWKERRTKWLSLGIRSEIGRGANLLKFSPQILEAQRSSRSYESVRTSLINSERDGSVGIGDVYANGTSVFDPVLCELAYRWFCRPGGRVLDPFAGGSVRGIVAGMLGRTYLGIELRKEQVEENRRQVETLCSNCDVQYMQGDSAQILPTIHDEFDLVFSCPPYYDLEQYSSDERDLSCMDEKTFEETYVAILLSAMEKLKKDRFVVFVVGNSRTKSNGQIRDMVRLTCLAAEKSGLSYYNDAILLNSAGSLALRVNRQFLSSRKLGRMHQYVLVFVRGDARAACADIPLENTEEVHDNA